MMRSLIPWMGSVLLIGSGALSLRGQDVMYDRQAYFNQQAAAANETYNHRLYENQTMARRGIFGPAYYGPVMGYGPYYQGYSIPSREYRRFGSGPSQSGIMVPMHQPRSSGY
jgi:hypothetical protein